MFENKEILNILNQNYPIVFNDIEFNRDGGSISYIAASYEKKYFLRIIRPALIEAAIQSINIHLYLYNRNFPVPAIILAKESRPYIKNSFEGQEYIFVLYEYIEGTEPSSADAEKAGELIGKFHDAMSHYPNELKHQDKYYFIDRYINILLSKKHKKTDIYKLIGERLWDKVHNLPKGYCHCDLYEGNILKAKDGKMYVLDFDTSCNAFPMYDVTLYCNETNYFEYSDEGFEKTKARLSHFLKGYLRYHTLTDEEIDAFYYFHAIYHYQLQAGIVEIYGLYCNEEDFEDKQLDWITSWLKRAESETRHDILEGLIL